MPTLDEINALPRHTRVVMHLYDGHFERQRRCVRWAMTRTTPDFPAGRFQVIEHGNPRASQRQRPTPKTFSIPRSPKDTKLSAPASTYLRLLFRELNRFGHHQGSMTAFFFFGGFRIIPRLWQSETNCTGNGELSIRTSTLQPLYAEPKQEW